MRICLIGATHPCHNPRLIREADTLIEQGHDVRVVAPCHSGWLAAKDQRLLKSRLWRLDALDIRPLGFKRRWARFVAGTRRHVARLCYRWLQNRQCAEFGYTAALSELKRLAAAEGADWFIAHAQGALPVAAWAASRWNASLGFDCEDLLSESKRDPVELVKRIEQAYFPRCDYISVPSTAMARRLQELYGINPIVLMNVFPARLSEGVKPPWERPRRKTLKLHWFSQVIGPGRGIEDAVCALEFLGSEVELHLRGFMGNAYRAELMRLADRCGVSSRLSFYPQVDHDEVLSTMTEFDIGLSLERPDDENYSLTITNKFFSYTLAGLPVIATQTPGNAEALSLFPNASASYNAGHPEDLASCVAQWLDNRRLLERAQRMAWDISRKVYCWDQESTKFLQILHGISRSRQEVESLCGTS